MDEKKPKLPPPLPFVKAIPKPPDGGPRPLLPGNAIKQQGSLQKPPLAGLKASEKTSVTRSSSSPAGISSGSSEVDEIRKQMETQIMALSQQLQEEKEKMLMQTVRVKEEEAMAAKVEESLKDIQDRLRREKREQELQDALTKAENHIKELEQRIGAERQTWVETLKSQVSQRESQDKDMERDFDLKLKELERRWHEEKLTWSQALRNKDEELARIKREADNLVANERTMAEKRIEQLESEKESFHRELKDKSEMFEQERNNGLAKLEARDKDYLSLKAQQAMVVTQMRQVKEKEDQMRALLERMRADKNTLITQVEAKEKDYFLLKTQFALYQTRAKTEQEKLLKEMVLYKEQANKDKEQWEDSLKLKDDEIRMVAESSRIHASELKQQLDKKEHEAASSAKAAEEKLKSRETEIRFILEKKEEEIKGIAKESEEKISLSRQDYARQLEQKDKEMRSQQIQWAERVQAKEKELASISGKERELLIQVAQNDSKITQLEEKLKAEAEIAAKERERVIRKENEFKSALAAEEEKTRNTGRELGEALSRLQIVNIELIKKEEQILSLKSGKENNSQKITELSRMLEEKDHNIAFLAEKERGLKETQAQLELKVRDLNEDIKKKAEEIVRLNENNQRVENENKTLFEKEREYRAVTVQSEQKLQENTEKLAKLEHEIWLKDEKINKAESESRLLLEKEKEYRVDAVKFELELKQSGEKLTRLEHEMMAIQVKLSQAENENKSLLEKEREFRIAAAQLEQKIKENSEKAARLDQEMRAKDTEIIRLEKANNLFMEKEKEYGIEASQYEQRAKEVSEKLAKLDQEIRAKDAKLGQVENENKILVERDKDYRIAAAGFEQKLRENSEKLERIGQELRAQENIANQKELHIVFLQEKSSKAERDYEQKLRAEQEKANEQIALAREELKDAVAFKEQEIRDLRNERESLKTESVRIFAEAASKEKEMYALKNEISARERAIDSEISRRESVFLHDKALLSEKLKKLETTAQESERLLKDELERHQREWKLKEDAYIGEKKQKDEIVERLKSENAALTREKDKILESKHELEDKNQAELMSVQRKQWETKEKINEIIKEKDAEIMALKDSQKGLEEKIRGELREKYSAEIEAIAKEKEELSDGVGNEVRTLRITLQEELKKKEEQLMRERLAWDARLREKDDALFNLEKKYNELNTQQKDGAIINRTQNIKETLMAEGAKNSAVPADKTPLNEVFEKTVVVNPSRKIEEATQVLPPPETVAAAAQPRETQAGRKGLFGLISWLWKSINEPVIEIGAGKDKNSRKQ